MCVPCMCVAWRADKGGKLEMLEKRTWPVDLVVQLVCVCLLVRSVKTLFEMYSPSNTFPTWSGLELFFFVFARGYAILKAD